MNKEQADSVIRRATQGKVKTFKDAQLKNISEQNEILNNIDNKLVEMVIVDTFESGFVGKFKNEFSEKRITIGAFMQLVGIGLGKGYKNEIKTGTDLLPNIENIQYLNYVKTFLTNFKQGYELLISNEDYKRAFTSMSSFGSYLNLFKTRIAKTFDKELYETSLQIMSESVLNVIDLGSFTFKSDADRASLLRSVFEKIIIELASHTPYGTTFNLGLPKGQTEFKINIANDSSRNLSGLDFDKLPAKLNTLDMKDIVGSQRFPSINLLLSPTLAAEYSLKVLGDLFHDSYNSLGNRFNSVLGVIGTATNVVNQKTASFKEISSDGKTETYNVICIDKDSFIIALNIEADTSMLWSKGVGGFLNQINKVIWATLVCNPFGNGVKFTFKIVDDN